MNNTVAIILAAGMGKRMGELTKDQPKSLVEVDNTSLVEYAIRFVKDIGIGDVMIVGGYHFDRLQDHVRSVDESIRIINNPDYECQNLTSLAKALPFVGDNNMLVCNSDYIFQKTTVHAVSQNLNGIAVYCSYDVSGDDDDDVMKVKVDSMGNMMRMSKDLTDFECIYTGIFFFASPFISDVKEVVSSLLQRNKQEATVEFVFEEFLKKGFLINVVDVGKANWIEIDNQEELQRARYAVGNE